MIEYISSEVEGRVGNSWSKQRPLWGGIILYKIQKMKRIQPCEVQEEERKFKGLEAGKSLEEALSTEEGAQGW